MSSPIDGAQFQVALGRILSEPELNERFVANPAEVGAELGLDAEQVEALESAGLDKLSTFSHNLASKRVGLLKKVCPATYELVHQRGKLGKLAGGFVRRHRPIESEEYSSRTIRDGFWFVEELLKQEAAGELNDPVLADVARFERAMLTVAAKEEALATSEEFAARAGEQEELGRDEILAARPRRGLHTYVEEFGIDIVPVIRTLGEGGKLEQAQPGESIVLFSKLPGWRNLRYATINRQTCRLLELCDGVATSREIIARLLKESLVETDPDEYADRCIELIAKLVQINVVTLDS